jgi:hypothetical protein
VIRALELDEPGARDMASDVASLLDVIDALVAPMEHERRGLHRPEHATDIGLALELVQRHRHPRARRLAVVGGPERDRLAIEAGATISTSIGPWPATWYAMCTPSADLA